MNGRVQARERERVTEGGGWDLFFFFVCVRTRGDTDMEENQGLPELCQGGGQRESQRLKKPDRQKETKKKT